MATLDVVLSKVIPESPLKDSLRKVYYKKLWYNKVLRDLKEAQRMLIRHRIRIEEEIEGLGKLSFGSDIDSMYLFYLNNSYDKFDPVKEAWYYQMLEQYLPEETKHLLPYLYAKEYGYLSVIEEIFEYEIYEKWYRLKPGDVILDVGANYGVFTIKAAKEVGPEGLVVAIEPDPLCIKLLKKNIELNGLNNVIIVQKAVWSSKTVLSFKRYPSTASNSIAKLKPKNLGEFNGIRHKPIEIIKVNTDTLESIIRDLKINKVDFIKMDIERAEVEAIKGSRETLMKYKPVLAIAAYHRIPPSYEKSYKLLIPLLQRVGYRNLKLNKESIKSGILEDVLYAYSI